MIATYTWTNRYGYVIQQQNDVATLSDSAKQASALLHSEATDEIDVLVEPGSIGHKTRIAVLNP